MGRTQKLGSQTPNWTPNETVAKSADEDRFHSRTSRTKVSLRLDRQLLKKVRVAIAVNSLNLQTMVELGLEKILAAEFNPNWAPSATGRPHDDLMIDDHVHDQFVRESSSESSTAEGIGRPDAQLARERELLVFYQAETGNRLKARDTDALRQVSHLPDSAIKAGIRTSILLCDTKVNSLKYCLGAIREAAESNGNREYSASGEARVPARPGTQRSLPSMGADVVEIPGRGKDQLRLDADCAPASECDPRNEFYSLLLAAIAEACAIDLSVCTDRQHAEVSETARVLCDAERTVDQVRDVGRWWYAHDWRAKKGSPPTPTQLREVWGKAALCVSPTDAQGAAIVVTDLTERVKRQLIAQPGLAENVVEVVWDPDEPRTISLGVVEEVTDSEFDTLKRMILEIEPDAINVEQVKICAVEAR